MRCLGSCTTSKWGRREDHGHGRWGWNDNLSHTGVYALSLPVICDSTYFIGHVIIMHVKCLAQCLTHNKCSLNVSCSGCYYYYFFIKGQIWEVLEQGMLGDSVWN